MKGEPAEWAEGLDRKCEGEDVKRNPKILTGAAIKLVTELKKKQPWDDIPEITLEYHLMSGMLMSHLSNQVEYTVGHTSLECKGKIWAIKTIGKSLETDGI